MVMKSGLMLGVNPNTKRQEEDFMKLNKLLLIVVLFLLVIPAVQAAQLTDFKLKTLGYFELEKINKKMDSAFGTGWGDAKANNLTFAGTGTSDWKNITGKIGNALYIETALGGFGATASAYKNLQRSQDFTVCAWIKGNDAILEGASISSWDAGEDTRWALYYDVNADNTGDVGLYWCNQWLVGDVFQNKPSWMADWQLYCITWNEAQNNVTVYLNTTRMNTVKTSVCGSNDATYGIAGGVLGYGTLQDYTIDNIIYYNKTIYMDNITWLYNLGVGQNLSAPSAAPTPVISASTNRTTTSSAVINWTTDIASNTSVKYGTTKAFGTKSQTNDDVTAHSRTLTTLSSNTKYYYNITSCKLSVCKENGTYTFTTKKDNVNLSITAASPPTNTQKNINIVNFRINFTSNITTGINCTINVTGTINSKILTLKRTMDYNHTFTTFGNYSWSAFCTNKTTYRANLSERYIFIDTTPPNASITTFRNNSAYYIKNMTFSVNATDDYMLFSLNVSVDGVSIFKKTNLNSSFYQANITKSPASLTPGVHRLTIRVADGHTAESISDMIVSRGLFNDYLTYELNKKKITIQNKVSSIFDEFSTIKNFDRYNWIYEPANPIGTQTFTISSDNPIYIKSKGDFKWIVTDKRWIDFDLKNENEVVTIKQITPKQVEVTISNIKSPARQYFQSIGELNVEEMNFTFFRVNSTYRYLTKITETQIITSNLTVLRNNSASTSAVFYYNKTAITPTKVSNATSDVYTISYQTPLSPGHKLNIPIFWNLTVGSETNKTKFNQYTYQMIVYNCTSANASRAIEFNSTIETTSSLLITNGTGIIKYWLGSSSLYRQSTIKWNNKNTSVMCVFNNNTLSTNWNLQYSNYGYTTRNNINLGTFLNHTYQKINLPLLAIASSSPATVYLIDQVSNPVKYYGISLARKDLGTGTYSVVQSEVTDINGASTFFQYASGTKYQLWIYNTTGQQVLNTGDMYLAASNTIRLQVGQASDFYLNEIYDAWNLRSYLSYKNTTHIFKLEWFTLSGRFRTICMNVTQTNHTRTSWLYGQCSASSSGNLTYNATGKSGTLTAVSYVTGSPPTILDILTIITTIRQTIKDIFGDEALILYLCLIIGASTMLLVDITLIPIGIVVVMIGTFIIGISPISLGMLVAFIIMSVLISNRVNEG